MASEQQGGNPVSTLNKHDKEYGTPVAGSKTEARAKLAHERISREILEMCCVIYDNRSKHGMDSLKQNVGTITSCENNVTMAAKENTDQNVVAVIDFKRLFDIYVGISNKLVGVLLRARKYGIVDFPGETLFQRRDDDVIIKLLYTPNEVKERLKEKTFSWGKCMSYDLLFFQYIPSDNNKNMSLYSFAC